ncbi:MAG: RNA polymerase sigma factor [Gemmatimonadota bacterium]
MSASDEQLAAAALAGSQSAFRELVERYERPVFNLVVRMVRDPALAEDLAQDAFVKAFARLTTFRPDQGKFSNWLFKVAHNTAIDHLRRGALDVVPLDGETGSARDFHALLADRSATTPYEAAERTDLAAALERAIARLRPEYRAVVTLRHQEDLAYEEIAAITELPLGTVKTYLHRARRELAAHLTTAGWAPEAAPLVPAGGETGAAPIS